MASGWGQPIVWTGFAIIHATLMPNGRVLFWPRNLPSSEMSYHTRARIWDSAAPTAALTDVTLIGGEDPCEFIGANLFCSGHSTMPDGRILVVGGHEHDDTGIRASRIFDPATSTWERAECMNYPRWYPTVTPLPNGKMFVTSGSITPGLFAKIPELYDPRTNKWTRLWTAEIGQSYFPFMFVAPNGKLFWAGGGGFSNPDRGANPNGSITRFLDPATWTWGPVITSATAGLKYGSAVMYEPGKILKTGGKPRGSDSDTYAVATCDTIDLNQPNPQWTSQLGVAVPPMIHNRWQHNMTILPNGTVFCSGGTTRWLDGNSTSGTAPNTNWLEAEIWTPTPGSNPPTGTWSSVPQQASVSRWYHSFSLLLPDGSVLTGGGNTKNGTADHDNGQIYYPSYFDLITAIDPQLEIVQAPAEAFCAQKFKITLPSTAHGVYDKVALIRPGSVTHSFDQSQRFMWLDFNPSTGVVTGPANTNLAPPGYYMLFAFDKRGANQTIVPSRAKFIKIRQSTGIRP